jgi:hypothetical protein
MRNLIHILVLTMAMAPLAGLTGCVRRTLEITTEPSGALIWVNGREVGRTPVSVDFTHYGTYDLMIQKKGWEPIIDARRAPVPVTDLPGPDLAVEILPIDVHHVVKWHIELQPRDTSRNALLKRADTLRDALQSGEDDGSKHQALDE